MNITISSRLRLWKSHFKINIFRETTEDSGTAFERNNTPQSNATIEILILRFQESATHEKPYFIVCDQFWTWQRKAGSEKELSGVMEKSGVTLKDLEPPSLFLRKTLYDNEVIDSLGGVCIVMNRSSGHEFLI